MFGLLVGWIGRELTVARMAVIAFVFCPIFISSFFSATEGSEAGGGGVGGEKEREREEACLFWGL